MDPNTGTRDHCLELAALSDIGLRRPNNQDALAVALASSQEQFEARGHLFVVADGMGSYAGGELASKLATDLIPLTYNKLVDRPPPEALRAAIQTANAQIHSRRMASDDFRQMGTTVSVLVLLPKGALAAHVGDTRIYRLRRKRLDQLTFDHSLVWELQKAGHQPVEELAGFIPKNIITRSLGPEQVEVDLEGIFPVEPGDTFLLCSDGLSGQVADEELGQVLAALPPKEAVRALVDLANLRGGPDNITVIVVRVTGPLVARDATSKLASSSGPERSHSAFNGLLVAMVLLLLVAATILGAFGWVAAAIGCLLGGVAAGLLLLGQRRGAGPWLDFSHRLGKGPHSSRLCEANGTFVSRLAGIAKELREATAGTDWTIDWETFNQHEQQAAAAAQAADYGEAVRQYCRAISFMMAQLRAQQDYKRHGQSDS